MISTAEYPLTAHERIQEVLANPCAGAKDLAQALARDPMIRRLVLKVANSAYYRRQEPVQDLTRAVTLLGFVEISRRIHLALEGAFPSSF